MDAPGTSFVLRDGLVVDAERRSTDRLDLLVINGEIADVSSRLGVVPSGLDEIDVGGLVVFPGLVDAHVHVTALRHNLRESAALPQSYTFGGAANVLRGMLSRGFTTVRDVGGADWGLAEAAADGTLGAVPRLLYCGQALSQTGGHGDMRRRGEQQAPSCSIGIVCDGEDDVRRTVRSLAAQGAHHIKLMLGGGVASEFDRLEGVQFTDAEVAVAVAESSAAGIYATAHAYTSEAVARAVRLGVRCIEHGNLIDDDTARLMAKSSTFLVPTLISYEELADLVTNGEAPSYIADKLSSVREKGLRALESASRAGVQTVFGSDLLGSGHSRQLEEFAIRDEVIAPSELLYSATRAAAKLANLEGVIGEISPGASADFIVSDLNPLERSLSKLVDHRYAVVSQGRRGHRLNSIVGR